MAYVLKAIDATKGSRSMAASGAFSHAFDNEQLQSIQMMLLKLNAMVLADFRQYWWRCAMNFLEKAVHLKGPLRWVANDLAMLHFVWAMNSKDENVISYVYRRYLFTLRTRGCAIDVVLETSRCMIDRYKVFGDKQNFNKRHKTAKKFKKARDNVIAGLSK